MLLTPAQLAAHAIRVKARAIARAAVEALYDARPDLAQRYGDAGRRHCAKDLGHHLRFLAAAVELDDPKVFTDYAAWAARVMVTHKVAPEDALVSFRCLLAAAPPAVPARSADAVRRILTSAVRHLESHPPRAPRRPRAEPGPFALRVAQTPSRS